MPGPLAREELQVPVEKALRDSGFDLVALKLVPRGGTLCVQIFIDRGEGGEGVTLGDCARASKIVQDQVDLERLLPERFVLEVSSPGVDRPLTRPEHYRRFRGESASVRLLNEIRGQRNLAGTIGDCDEEGVVLELEGGVKERLRFAEIANAHLKVDVWKGSRRKQSLESQGGKKE